MNEENKYVDMIQKIYDELPNTRERLRFTDALYSCAITMYALTVDHSIALERIDAGRSIIEQDMINENRVVN